MQVATTTKIGGSTTLNHQNTVVTTERRRILITTNQSKNGSPYSELVFKTVRIIDKHAISICYSLP